MEQAEQLLTHESGLLAISGRTADMQRTAGAGSGRRARQARGRHLLLPGQKVDWRLCGGARRSRHAGVRRRHRRARAAGQGPHLRRALVSRRGAGRCAQCRQRRGDIGGRVPRARPGDRDQRSADDGERSADRAERVMTNISSLPESLRLLDAYWRAANYLSVGQIYLLDNPLLQEPLQPAHIKPRLLGHWGTTPGQNFIYAHLNRLITALDLDMIYLSGPGHGGPAVVANVYLEGTYSEVYPKITQGSRGTRRALPAVFVSRRHPQPRGAGNARQHSRRRRARLLVEPRLRRGLRQPRSDRGLRDRRRRSRNRPARHLVALEQVPQSRHRRRGAADPAPERLQDREPGGAGADSTQRARRRCCAAAAGRRTSSKGDDPALPARRDGADARRRGAIDSRHPGRRAQRRLARPSHAGR